MLIQPIQLPKIDNSAVSSGAEPGHEKSLDQIRCKSISQNVSRGSPSGIGLAPPLSQSESFPVIDYTRVGASRPKLDMPSWSS